MKKLAFLSSTKIPEFIREEYPALVTFVEEYYRYLETLSSYEDITDIDNISDEYLKLYKDSVARGFGDPNYLSIRKFIYSNKDFFSKKGTPAAFEYFFKAYFGETITIRTPNYLIASGGEITGSYYFYVSISNGTVSEFDTLIVTTDAGDVHLKIDRVELLDSSHYALYFNPPRGFLNQVGNRVKVLNASNIATFNGLIIPTPYRIIPIIPGKYWQIGQVIILPSTGSGLPTIARVTRITPDGGIASIEVVQFEYPQTAIQYTISSFSSQNIGSSDFAELNTVEISEGVFEYTLDVHDNLVGLTDSITGVQTELGGDGYFSESYQLEDYAGGVAVDQSSGLEEVGDYTQDSPEWLESLATIQILTGPLARERYEYQSENSLISNQNTKLHDSLFFQAFAYSIETEQNIEDYRGSIDLIHPAGLKFSAILAKRFEVINTTPSFETSGFPHGDGVESILEVGDITFGITLAITGNVTTSNIGTIA